MKYKNIHMHKCVIVQAIKSKKVVVQNNTHIFQKTHKHEKFLYYAVHGLK